MCFQTNVYFLWSYILIIHSTRLVDVPSQHAHVAKFTISTCFERSSCDDHIILDNTILLKEPCDLTASLKSELKNFEKKNAAW